MIERLRDVGEAGGVDIPPCEQDRDAAHLRPSQAAKAATPQAAVIQNPTDGDGRAERSGLRLRQ